MEGTAAYAPVLAYLAECAASSGFVVVDIGCSGGIDEIWRSFGPRLRVIGFDPNVAEIERLRSLEPHPAVEYVAAFAALPHDHEFARRKAGRGDWGRTPWSRLSVARSLDIMKAQPKSMSAMEMTAVNRWPEVTLADQTVVVPAYLRERGIASVDFLKIDIDGKDLDVLHSFDSAVDDLAILGAGLEVNFHGSAEDTDHTFHNTDRLMKGAGFELFNLTVRRYSLAALPSQYLMTFPAQTKFGRPLQGDALYIRDLGNPEFDPFTAGLLPTKLLNLVCLFAAFDLPDCAAEIAVRFGKRLASLCDVDHVLDLLAAQAQGKVKEPLPYRQYMERFEAQDSMFFPSASPRTTSDPARLLHRVQARLAPRLPGRVRSGLRRIRRAWRAWHEPL
jgi:FkbM family methyltransferase